MMVMLSLAWAQNFGSDSEVPAVLSYNSPLRQPDSLRSRPYFDFLSTLYRHDTEKSSLFQPYLHRSRREAVVPHVPIAPAESDRSRRAVVFRPLFVYKQQEIRKQQIQAQRKRRV